MPRQLVVVTPENIPLILEPAGLATRFCAMFIDLLLQLLAGLVFLVLFASLAALGISFDFLSGEPGKGGVLGYIAIAVLVLLVFAFFSGYFIVFELLWNGQTPGKRVFNLRVVRDGGYPIDLGASAARNLVRMADFLPISYALGALTMFFNPNYKRLGDLVGGTVVIKERPGVNLPDFKRSSTAAFVGQTSRLPEGTVNPYNALTSDELMLLRQFSTRRWQMTSDDSERLAYRLVAPLVSRLSITFVAGAAPRYADLASAIVAAADEQEAQLNNR
jgi:uncharacterized RDD family membrane protein YckC